MTILRFRHYYDDYEIRMLGTTIKRITKTTDNVETEIRFIDLPEFIQEHLSQPQNGDNCSE